MEAIMISGAQGLGTEGLGVGEGGEVGRRYRQHSIDGVGRSFPSAGRGPYSPESRTPRGRFNSDLGTGAFEQAAKYLRPDKISLHPLFGRSTKRRGIRVKINVSGMIFETLESTLSRFPNSLLGSPKKREKYYDSKKREFFFDRNRVAFDAILYFYQSHGKLLRPAEIDRKTFFEEIQFFELGEDVVERFKATELNVEPESGPLPANPIQRKIWEVMELPHSSLLAQIVAIWSVFVILLSIVIFCIETLPRFRESRNDKGSTLYGFEIFCVAWFTFEYVARLMAAPQKFRFVRGFLNIIDLVAILPYYIILGLSAGGGGRESGNASSVAFFRILRLVRVFRIFKLSRHYRGLKILGMTLRASLRELLLLSFFLLMGVIIFSSGVYYAESANFGSIPEAFWWSVVTMTTVSITRTTVCCEEALADSHFFSWQLCTNNSVFLHLGRLLLIKFELKTPKI